MTKKKKCKECEGFKKDKFISECAGCGQTYKLVIIKKHDKKERIRRLIKCKKYSRSFLVI